MSCQLPTPSALTTLALWLFSDIPNSAHLRVSALALSSAWNASPPCSCDCLLLTTDASSPRSILQKGFYLINVLTPDWTSLTLGHSTQFHGLPSIYCYIFIWIILFITTFLFPIPHHNTSIFFTIGSLFPVPTQQTVHRCSINIFE